MNSCYACEKGSRTTGHRVCPDCGHVFQGAGWAGIDATGARDTSRSPMSFEAFMATSCAAHEAPFRPAVARQPFAGAKSRSAHDAARGQSPNYDDFRSPLSPWPPLLPAFAFWSLSRLSERPTSD